MSVERAARAGAGRVLVATFVTLGLTYGFWYSYAVLLVAFLREFGWSRSVVAGAFSLMVMGHGLSGPLLGWLVERFGLRAVIATGGGVLVLAGAHAGTLLPYGYAVLIGVGYAVTAPLTPAIASDLFGGPRFARIFGTLHFINPLGGALGAWAAGAIFDRTASYALALPVAAALALLAPALLWVVAPRRPNPAPAPS